MPTLPPPTLPSAAPRASANAFDALDGAAPLVNRVAESEIDVLDLGAVLEGALGETGEVAVIDIAPWLHRGLVLREVPFRAAVAAHDWAAYASRAVALTCSTDALVPTWAWMLVAARLADAGARYVGVGDGETVRSEAVAAAIAGFDAARYADRIVVVKGCGAHVPPTAYAAAMRRLALAGARKVMYGEPCSSVPLWRRPKTVGTAPTPIAPPPPAAP